MGLDCSHDAWHGPYSAFTRWRNAVAQAAGYEIRNVRYENGLTLPTVMIEWHRIRPKNYMGEWDETPSDPLIVLIAHSDCEGEIRPEQAGPLAARLEELLPKLEDEPAWGAPGSMRRKTEQFIAGLRAAAAAGEPVDFH